MFICYYVYRGVKMSNQDKIKELNEQKKNIEKYSELVKAVAETRSIDNQTEEKQKETKEELERVINKIKK